MTMYGHINYLISFFFGSIDMLQIRVFLSVGIPSPVGSIDMLQIRVFLSVGIPLPCRVKGMRKNYTRVRVMSKLRGYG